VDEQSKGVDDEDEEDVRFAGGGRFGDGNGGGAGRLRSGIENGIGGGDCCGCVGRS